MDPTKILEKILDPHTNLHGSVLSPQVIDLNKIIGIDQKNTSGSQLLQGCLDLMTKPSITSLISGITIHKLIHDDFVTRVDGALGRNFEIPGSSSIPLRTQGLCGEDSTVIKPQGLGGQAGKGFPDLARITANGILQIAEIKPASQGCLVDGEDQLLIYINQANAKDPEQQAWRVRMGIKVAVPMSTSTFPASNYLVGNARIETAWCSDGILVYRIDKSERERIPIPVPYKEKLRARDEMKREAEEKGYKLPVTALAATAAGASIIAATKTATWRHFWRAVIIRFGLRESIAASLAAVDGPLPFGDLLTIGITVFTAIEIIVKYPELWEEAEAIARG